MPNDWISVTEAISRLAGARCIKTEKAVWPMWQLARDGIVESRIGKIVSSDDSPSRRNVPIYGSDWDDIKRLQDYAWFSEGSVYFPDDTAWNHIQILAADLESFLKSEKAKSQPWLAGHVPKRTFISLSEALSWIAFGEHKNKDQLEFLLESPEGSDAGRKLTDALQQLSERLNEGRIELLARELIRHSEDEADVIYRLVDPQELQKFSCFDVDHDGLARGTGLVGVAKVGEPAAERHSDGLHDVRVCHSKLVELFPRPHEPTEKSVAPTARDEKRCADWLRKAIEADSEHQLKKGQFRDKALEHFNGGLTRRGFDRVWASVAPSLGRSTPGRKLKQRIETPKIS